MGVGPAATLSQKSKRRLWTALPPSAQGSPPPGHMLISEPLASWESGFPRPRRLVAWPERRAQGGRGWEGGDPAPEIGQPLLCGTWPFRFGYVSSVSTLFPLLSPSM